MLQARFVFAPQSARQHCGKQDPQLVKKGEYHRRQCHGKQSDYSRAANRRTHNACRCRNGTRRVAQHISDDGYECAGRELYGSESEAVGFCGDDSLKIHDHAEDREYEREQGCERAFCEICYGTERVCIRQCSCERKYETALHEWKQEIADEPACNAQERKKRR